VEALIRLPVGIAAVVFSALLFTNALEWLGHRLHLGQAALGSVFAAMGTALPEASIAFLAAVAPGTGGGGQAVSVGAVLGAPLLLATLGFAVLGLGTYRAGHRELTVPQGTVRRDLVCYLVAFGSAAGAGIVGLEPLLRLVLALVLLVGYGVYVWRTVGASGGRDAARDAPPRLWLARRRAEPPLAAILIQLVLAVALMLLGARLFVSVLTGVAADLALSGFVLAVLIAPLATELPETVNSVLWIAQDKDALAAGNVIGAMVLQGAVVPAVGLAFTAWHFDGTEAVAAGVALVGALIPLAGLGVFRRLPAWLLLIPAVLYVAFVIWVL
jgi:cation:H+ antiporter